MCRLGKAAGPSLSRVLPGATLISALRVPFALAREDERFVGEPRWPLLERAPCQGCQRVKDPAGLNLRDARARTGAYVPKRPGSFMPKGDTISSYLGTR
jgi:hypothetical protein